MTRRWMAPRRVEGSLSSFLPAAKVIHQTKGETVATKAQEIYERVQAMEAEGIDKSDAFKTIAAETKRPYDSVRGSFYTHKRKLEGGSPSASSSSRSRRRETTPDDALADARAALERALEAIGRETEAAKARAQEAAAEYESIRGSAGERKEAIQRRLESLK
jgi:hypothetical protein